MDLHDEFNISLLELDGPILRDLDVEIFEALQSILKSGANMLWVNNPRKGQETPCSGVLEGLARVLHTENPQLVFVTLAMESWGLPTRPCFKNHASLECNPVWHGRWIFRA